MVALRNDLGGSAGFGEGSLPRGELIGSTEIDLGAFYNASAGLKFLGGFYTDLRIYSSGLIQFNPTTVPRQDLPSHYGIFGGFGAAIAPFWSPVDTARSALAPSPGGTSTGSNLVWYDLDEVTGRFTVTWDDVRLWEGYQGEYEGGPGVNAFQMELTPASGPGATSIDFDVTFRYEHLGLTSYSHPLANFTWASSTGTAIFQDGSTRFAGADVQYELAPSVAADADRDNLDPDALQGLITDSNVGEAGIWRFAFRQGWLTPEVTVEDVTVTEGTGPGATFAPVTVRLKAGVPQAVTLTWQAIADTGNPATDLLAASGSVTFAPWETERTIQVPINRDAIEEGTETLTLRLSGQSPAFLTPGGAVLLDRDATITILDDEITFPVFSFATSTLSLLEGDGSSTFFRFDVTRSGNLTGTDRVQWTVALPSGADAASASDLLDAIRLRDLVFRPGETTQQITVRVAGDRVIEGNERFEVVLANPQGTAMIDPAAGRATGNILTDDGRLVVTQPAPQAEGDSATGATHVIALARSETLDLAQTVSWFIPVAQRGWLAAGQAFEGVAEFAPGEAGTSISIGTRGNAQSQGDRSISVQLRPDAGFKAGGGAVPLRIIDDDQLLSVRAISADKAEGAAGETTPFTFRIAREGLTTQAVDVAWEMLSGFPWPADSSDFSGPTSGVVTLGVGVRQVDLTLNVVGDALAEDWEDFFVGIESLSLRAVVAPGGGLATGRIRDDDGGFRRGSSDSDVLVGLDTGDRIDGEAGNDTIAGLGGDDVLRGNAGLDLIRGGLGADTLEGGGDNDTLIGGLGDDVLDGGEGSDNLNGEEGQDSLAGGEGDDVLRGDAGADTLVGGAGRDTLIGGLGADLMEGGLGADRFSIFSLAEAQGDVILDFNPAQLDRLDLSRLDANAGMAGDQAFAWIGDAAFGGVAGQLRFANQVLEGDVTGDGVADFQIGLTGVFSLSAAAIWL